jgi:hypothetical protein
VSSNDWIGYELFEWFESLRPTGILLAQTNQPETAFLPVITLSSHAAEKSSPHSHKLVEAKRARSENSYG